MLYRSLFYFLVLLIVLLGCSQSVPTPTPTPKPRLGSAITESHMAFVCPHFRNILRDVADGVLTEEELRQKFGEVHSDLRGLRSTGNELDGVIYRAARQLYASVTPPWDSEQLENATLAMHHACDAFGY